MDAADKLFDNPDTTGYQTNDPEKPFMFSCLIGRHLSTVSVLSKLKQIVYGNVETSDKK